MGDSTKSLSEVKIDSGRLYFVILLSVLEEDSSKDKLNWNSIKFATSL